MNWYSADPDDTFGRKFFSRRLVASGYFLATGVLFGAVLVCSTWFYFTYHSRLPLSVLILLLICIPLRALHSLQAALMRHRGLRNLYYSQSSSNVSVIQSANAAMGVAARSILDDLFYTFMTLLALLGAISLVLRAD
jgi:hypothetical protein